MKLLKSAGRILAATTVTLLVIVVVFGAVVRQPTYPVEDPFRGTPADPQRLRGHVEFLCSEVESRSFRDPTTNELIQKYIEREFAEASSNVGLQRYKALSTDQANVIAHFGPDTGERIVVGAHYDTFGYLPGADDNASGVAGLLELSRLLALHPPSKAVELVAYGTEEPPNFGSEEMGSAVHASSLAGQSPVPTMFCLEMIGYFSPRQPVHSYLLSAVYPRHGHWVSVVGRWQDRRLARAVKGHFRNGTDLPVYSYSGPVALGADLSDHRNYWARGINAVMITDTAYLRNPNYHTEADTSDSLDYNRMAKVVDGVLCAVLRLGGLESSP